MNEFLNQETPGKVFALLGTSLLTLAFLFGVSLADASFAGASKPLPDLFGPAKVMAVLDTASNSYSKFVASYIVKPGAQDYGVAADNLSWVFGNAGEELGRLLSVRSAARQSRTMLASAAQDGMVAGAATAQLAQGSFNIDSIYRVLVQ